MAAGLLARDRNAVPEALNLADDRRSGRREAAVALLDVLERRKEAEELLWLTSEVGAKERDPIEILVQAAAILWAKVPQAERPGLVTTELNERLSRARAAGYPWCQKPLRNSRSTGPPPYSPRVCAHS